MKKNIISAAAAGIFLIVVAAGAKHAGIITGNILQEKEQNVLQTSLGRSGAETVTAEEKDAYQKAGTDLVLWYEDASYDAFFQEAAERYFAENGIKVLPEYRNTLDYIGDIYDKTMQEEEYPDVCLMTGDCLEEAYLYGLICVNKNAEIYESVLDKAVEAATYQDKMLGYPLSFDSCVFVYQNGYFENEPDSLQAIIDYSNENEPPEDVEYLLEWDVNDPFYDFPFISNGVKFEKTESEGMNVVYQEALYQQDLDYFAEILESFSIDADHISIGSILDNFLSGRTLCAFIDTDSLAKLQNYDYSLMKIPDLNDSLKACSCATTDVLVVNGFSEQTKEAQDFAEFVMLDMADELHGLTGHYSVIPGDEQEWADKVAYESYESAVLAPDSEDARDFWVKLEETICYYLDNHNNS